MEGKPMMSRRCAWKQLGNWWLWTVYCVKIFLRRGYDPGTNFFMYKSYIFVIKNANKDKFWNNWLPTVGQWGRQEGQTMIFIFIFIFFKYYSNYKVRKTGKC